MNKMKFETPNLTAENVARLAELFPGVVADGKVNVDLLRSYVGEELFGDEAYEFTWVGKRAAIAEAGRPINVSRKFDFVLFTLRALAAYCLALRATP